MKDTNLRKTGIAELKEIKQTPIMMEVDEVHGVEMIPFQLQVLKFENKETKEIYGATYRVVHN